MIAPTGTPLKILRYELSCEPISLLSWLHNQKVDHKIYWSDRDKALEVAGIGIADILKSKDKINYKELFEYMEDRLSIDNPHLRYYGGFSFHESSSQESWQHFNSCRFVIPQFEMYHSKENTRFVFNIAIKDIHEDNIKKALCQLENIDFSRNTNYRTAPVVQSRQDYPNKESWYDVFNKAMEQLKQACFDKIVLARKSTFEFNKPIDPMALIKHLKDITPHCYHFCFQVGRYDGFLGATPERLYKRDDLIIETEAVAGTILRGKSNAQDLKNEQMLLNSTKDSYEHQFVVDEIKKDLSHLCHSVDVDKKARLLTLKDGHHLITKMRGELHEDISDSQIIQSLHPTPAVAGSPVKQTMDAIQSTEPFHRGWYAGPVGYVGADCSEFAVAIRSSLVNEQKLSLFAGAGIVKGSDMDNEWDEIEQKISSFINVFNI